MRDALSILDKIVSFTNGELNYANTLEHLNILDADYYFRLLHCMQEQDLSGALLLYDDINRKGFEGDLVLNGFAEFIRNLLVCRDEKVAGLLEVVEGFREKYMETAKNTSPAILISALNILNEAEIGFKAARNKRLHVELALIKLCYLQQALDLSTGVKKKRIDTVKPVAFRQLHPLELKKSTPNTSEAKLIIETPVAPPPRKPETTPTPPKANPVKGSSIAALDKIRKQYRNSASQDSGTINEPLSLDSLTSAWQQYIAQLKKNRNPAAQPFELAVLRVKDDNSFEAVTANNIEQKFIEQERNPLFEFLQQQLRNRALQFTVVIEEKTEERPMTDLPLSSKEQFQKMADQYPLVKTLRDRLRLDLDY